MASRSAGSCGDETGSVDSRWTDRATNCATPLIAEPLLQRRPATAARTTSARARPVTPAAAPGPTAAARPCARRPFTRAGSVMSPAAGWRHVGRSRHDARHRLDALVVADQHRADPAHPLAIDEQPLRDRSCRRSAASLSVLVVWILPTSTHGQQQPQLALAVEVLLVAVAQSGVAGVGRSGCRRRLADAPAVWPVAAALAAHVGVASHVAALRPADARRAAWRRRSVGAVRRCAPASSSAPPRPRRRSSRSCASCRRCPAARTSTRTSAAWDRRRTSKPSMTRVCTIWPCSSGEHETSFGRQHFSR